MAFKNTEFLTDPLIPAKMGFFSPSLDFQGPNSKTETEIMYLPAKWSQSGGQMKWGGRFVSIFLLGTLRQIWVQPGLPAGLVRGNEERGWVSGPSQGPAWCSQARASQRPMEAPSGPVLPCHSWDVADLTATQ